MIVRSEDLAGSYAPRAAWFERWVDCGPATIKLSIISFSGSAPARTSVELARRKIEQTADAIAATDHCDAGFAVLHEGTQALWLLLHWWTAGGVATRKMWRADRDGGDDFSPVDPLVMACVWELGIIDFERRAWMTTAMSGKPVSDYLELTFPRGAV